jgi:hypothetical protein
VQETEWKRKRCAIAVMGNIGVGRVEIKGMVHVYERWKVHNGKPA